MSDVANHAHPDEAQFLMRMRNWASSVSTFFQLITSGSEFNTPLRHWSFCSSGSP